MSDEWRGGSPLLNSGGGGLPHGRHENITQVLSIGGVVVVESVLQKAAVM